MSVAVALLLAVGTAAASELPAARPTTSATAPATAPAVAATPAPAAVNLAMRQVQELCSRQRLDARGLLELSVNTTSSPALRYAAALRAMQMAADAGQARVAQDAVQELCLRFAADDLPLKSALVQRLSRSQYPQAAAILGIRYLDDALAAGQMSVAAEITKTIAAANSSLDPQLASLCEDAIKDYRHACQLLPLRSPATAPAVSGEYACLYQDRWDDALSVLASGGSDLAPLAKEDLAAGDLAARTQVAERWWRAGYDVGGRIGWRIGRRACAIYRAILPQVDGVQRALILSRLDEHRRQAMTWSGVLPGVMREIWKEGSAQRTRRQVATLELARDAEVPDLPRSGAHARFSGSVLVEQAGRYELICVAGSGLRLKVDGKTLADNPVAYRKRSGEKFALQFSPGLHSIEIEVWSASSRPRLEMSWITPRSSVKQPLPESALFHDCLDEPTPDAAGEAQPPSVPSEPQ